jgi:hypothetical protein
MSSRRTSVRNRRLIRRKGTDWLRRSADLVQPLVPCHRQQRNGIQPSLRVPLHVMCPCFVFVTGIFCLSIRCPAPIIVAAGAKRQGTGKQ